MHFAEIILIEMKNIKYIKKLLNGFLFVIYFSALGQNTNTKTTTVYINYPDYEVKAKIKTKETPIHIKDTISYFWYKSNRILKTQGGYEGKLLHGPYTSFYLNGNLKEQGQFKNGVKNGKWISWFDNGMYKGETIWCMGLKHGLCKEFNNKGNLVRVSNYKRGMLHGKMYELLDSKIISEKKYKRNIEQSNVLDNTNRKQGNLKKWATSFETKMSGFFNKIKKSKKN